jgi:hypothetical protein
MMEFSLLSFEEVPKTLYHYTSLEALVSIVRSKRLRASNIRYLNDESEALRLRESVVTLLKERESNLREAEMIMRIIEQIEERSKQSLFVASLSAESDLLSQWRAYCPPGLGVSIGFSSDSLSEQWVANPSGGEPFFLSAIFQKVRYFSMDHSSALREMLERLISLELEEWDNVNAGELNHRVIAACTFPGFMQPSSAEAVGPLDRMAKFTIDEIVKVEGTPDFNPAPRFATIGSWVSQLAPFIKHEAFEEECEWRKVVSKDYRLVPGQQFRPGKSTLIPFVEIMLDVMQVGSERVPRPTYFINEVIIGPTPTPELTREALYALFTSEGHPEVVIRSSRIPYKSW